MNNYSGKSPPTKVGLRSDGDTQQPSKDDDNSTTTPESSACSMAYQLFCTTANAPSDICNAMSTCCHLSSTGKGDDTLPASSNQLIPTDCTNALVQINRTDLNGVANTVQEWAPDAMNAFCSATKQNIQLINQSTDLADNMAKLYKWYYQDVGPAIMDACNKTPTPITPAEMIQSSKQLRTAICGQTDILNLPKEQLIVIKYFKPIIAIVIGIIVFFILLTIILSSKVRHTRKLLYANQLECLKSHIVGTK